MQEPPKEIEITFQEEDRQKAEPFQHGRGCLVATALKRMGHKNVSSALYHHNIDGFTYYCPHTDIHGLHGMPSCAITDGVTGPFYGPEVVGKKITLVLQND